MVIHGGDPSLHSDSGNPVVSSAELASINIMMAFVVDDPTSTGFYYRFAHVRLFVYFI